MTGFEVSDEDCALHDHGAMVRTKVAALSSKERAVLCQHYFSESARGIRKGELVADLAEALMSDPKSPLFFEG